MLGRWLIGGQAGGLENMRGRASSRAHAATQVAWHSLCFAPQNPSSTHTSPPFSSCRASVMTPRRHNYERNYAVLNGTLATGASSGLPGGNASSPEVLRDPAATVYIVSGCAGDVEQHEPFTLPQPAYSAFRSNTFGFGMLEIANATHLLWTATQTDAGQPATTGSVIDAMRIERSGGVPAW